MEPIQTQLLCIYRKRIDKPWAIVLVSLTHIRSLEQWPDFIAATLFVFCYNPISSLSWNIRGWLIVEWFGRGFRSSWNLLVPSRSRVLSTGAYDSATLSARIPLVRFQTCVGCLTTPFIFSVRVVVFVRGGCWHAWILYASLVGFGKRGFQLTIGVLLGASPCRAYSCARVYAYR